MCQRIFAHLSLVIYFNVGSHLPETWVVHLVYRNGVMVIKRGYKCMYIYFAYISFVSWCHFILGKIIGLHEGVSIKKIGKASNEGKSITRQV